MSKNNEKVSALIWNEVEEDNYFAHCAVGAIDSMKIIIAKLTIGIESSQTPEVRSIDHGEMDTVSTSIMEYSSQINEAQMQFISACVKFHRREISDKSKKILSREAELYGDDFTLAEVDDLIEKREQRNNKLNESFREILLHPRTVTGG